jgi:uncharacterized protein (TIGR02099 family)
MGCRVAKNAPRKGDLHFLLPFLSNKRVFRNNFTDEFYARILFLHVYSPLPVKHILTRSTKIVLEVVLFIVLISAIALGLFRVFFSQLDRYKPDFEEWASSALHQPVQILHIKASWNGLHPSVRMEEVDVLDASTRGQQLHIQRLEVDMQVFSSLLKRRFVPSAVTVVGAHLRVQRVDADMLDVNGIPIPLAAGAISPTGFEAGQAIRWILEQGDIRLENIDLDWKTEKGREFHFTQLSSTLLHRFFKTRLKGVATLGEKVPAKLRFVVGIRHSDLAGVAAHGYLSVQQLDLTPWLSYLPMQKTQMTQGKLESLQVWADWDKRQWQSAQALVQLKDAQFISAFFKQPISVDIFRGNLAWERRPDGFAAAADKVTLRINQQVWPITKWSVLQSTSEAGVLTQVGSVDALDIAQLSARMQTFVPAAPEPVPAPEALTKAVQPVVAPIQEHDLAILLAKLKPQGRLTDLLLRRDVSPAGESLFSARIPFSGLNTQPVGKIPAVQGLQGTLKFTPAAGDLQLKGQSLQLDIPSFFTHRLPADTYQGRVQWLKQPEGLTVRAHDVMLSNDDLALQAGLALWLPHAIAESPYAALSATFTEQKSSRLRDYIPLGMLRAHPALAVWLTEAFVAGDGASGKIQLQGPLAHFPFDDQSGHFSAEVAVKNMQFNYKTGWPMLSHVYARALFQGASLRIVAAPGAQVLGSSAAEVKAEIPDLRHPILTVQGSVKSDLQTGARFIAESPLRKTIGEGIENLRLEGAVDLDLGLHVPLHPGEAPVTVEGKVAIAPGAKLEVPAWKLYFTHFSGHFGFTEGSLFADKLTARWEGQPVTIQIQTKKIAKEAHTIEIALQGRTTVAALEKAYPLPLKKKFSGEMPYRVLLAITNKGGHPQMMCSIDSDLQGLAIDLPAPFQKAAAEKSPLHVEIRPQEKTTLRVLVDYAKKLKATAGFTQNAQKSWSLKQAEVQLSADIASVFGIALASAHLQIQAVQKAWLLRINSAEVRGEVMIPEDTNALWKGSFSYLRIIPSTSNIKTKVHPGDIPSLDLEVKNFYYGTKPFGSISLSTSTGKNFLQIVHLRVKSGETRLVARGRWQESPGGHQQTTLSGNVRSENIGTALHTWQVTDSVVGGHGRAAFALSWPSMAYDFSFAALNGSFSLSFEKGRIVNISDSKAAEMGIGRILNLLSLQSIPRRLTLDFSDLLQKGFPFDVMKGELTMRNGQAFTENSYLNGPIAKVAIKGRIGMASKDYDLLMMTTPYLTSSLPIAATLIGGPIAGAAAWLGSKVLSGVVNKITMRTYKVTGPWDTPLIVPFSAN